MKKLTWTLLVLVALVFTGAGATKIITPKAEIEASARDGVGH